MRAMAKRNESGMVSIFIVIFTALLVTIVSVAFVRIMIQEQEKATTSDLSKSALDSAYAGVEDAKRAIIRYKQQCSGENATSTECTNLASAFNAQGCDTLQRVGIVGNASDKEVQVQQSADDAKLQQAYTCVKVQLDTKDYVGNISANASRLIHLRATGAFNQVTIEWYSQKDLQAGQSNDGTGKVDLYSGTQIPPALPRLNTTDNDPSKLWPKNRPALLRVQLLQVAKSFKLSDFDKNDDDKRDDASLFLYPATFGDTTASFSNDLRLSSATGSFRMVKCDETFSTTGGVGPYACRLTITIPNPVNSPDGTDGRDVYLRVSELYNTSTSFSVTLQDGTSKPPYFKAVQPAVDSTGRANDLFRRISSRIDLESSSIPGLEAAVDISGSLCKNFIVTDDATDFHDNCSNLTASAPPNP